MSLRPAQSSLTVPAYIRWALLHNKYSTGTALLPQFKFRGMHKDKGKVQVLGTFLMCCVQEGKHNTAGVDVSGSLQ